MAISANVINAALSLGAAGTWGTGDFVGGLAARRAHTLGVLFVMQLTGLCGLTLLALATHEARPSLTILLWSFAAGIANVTGFVAFYRALSIGKMGVNAPVTAVITAGIPVIFGIATEGLPHAVQIAGFAVALIGIWLLAKPDIRGVHSKGIGLAMVAGVLFSAFLILMKVAGEFTTGWPLAIARFAGVIVAGALLAPRRGERLPQRSALPLSIFAGVLDSGGTVFFLPALRHGRLDVTVVLASLYPVTTVVLARLLLKERLSAIQTAGVVAALAAVPMIAS